MITPVCFELIVLMWCIKCCQIIILFRIVVVVQTDMLLSVVLSKPRLFKMFVNTQKNWRILFWLFKLFVHILNIVSSLDVINNKLLFIWFTLQLCDV